MGRMTKVRKIVKIDADKCDGCGLCVPSCAEGAIRIVDGKARLVAENLCDGLGDCLGTCPKDAITIERRPAEAFDAEAGHAHAASTGTVPGPVPKAPEGGCPGSMVRLLHPAASAPAGDSAPSALRHWPVQLALLPERGSIWDDADVLLAADCVPVVMPDFHRWLLEGKTVAVACPKLDDTTAYLAKLTRIFAANSVRSVTVAHMEVPCCFGLKALAEQALTAAGKGDIPVRAITIGLDGRVKE